MKKTECKNLNIIEDYPIAKQTSFEVGGQVKYFSEIKSIEQLQEALEFSRNNNIKIIYIGDGSNIYFPDEKSDVLVIKNSLKGIRKKDESIIEVFSGTALRDVVDYFVENSLTGIEKLSGIPGTIGGAVYGNAGAFGMEIKDITEEIHSISLNGKIILRKKSEIKFKYRWSEYKENGEFIFKVILRGNPGNKDEIKEEVREIINYRKERLPENPPIVKSAGSFFKNILLSDGSKIAVGKLLDELGAKGLTFGGAKVSEKHANFIINYDNAKASDIENLSEKLKYMIKEKYSFDLEQEVISAKDLLK